MATVNQVIVERMTKGDYDEILRSLDDFLGAHGDRAMALNDPIMFYEFGDSAFVTRLEGRVAGYVMGFLSQTGPVGCVHALAVRTPWRRRGIGRVLFARFERYAHDHGSRALKAVAVPEDPVALAFYRKVGMRLMGPPDEHGLPVVRDYAGEGAHRLVFLKELEA